MASISRSLLLPYRAQQLFDLVSDIEAYPDFMDGCVGAEVLHREAGRVEARLDLARGGVSQSFVTCNRMVDAEHISLELIDGPFRQFQGRWEFTPLGESGCKVSFDLSFQVDNAVLSAPASRLFDLVTNNLVAAVERRARELYG